MWCPEVKFYIKSHAQQISRFQQASPQCCSIIIWVAVPAVAQLCHAVCWHRLWAIGQRQVHCSQAVSACSVVSWLKSVEVHHCRQLWKHCSQKHPRINDSSSKSVLPSWIMATCHYHVQDRRSLCKPYVLLVLTYCCKRSPAYKIRQGFSSMHTCSNCCWRTDGNLCKCKQQTWFRANKSNYLLDLCQV